ncbi:MAG: FAD:protein FMN transferase [Kiritimatiellia bacterium]
MRSLKSSLLGTGLGACVLLAGCGGAPVERLEWPVMGTVAAVQTRGAAASAAASAVREVARRKLQAVEARLNAHDPQSELARLAACTDSGVVARCAADVRPCYEAAFALRQASGGAFNPRWRGPDTLDLGAIAKGFAVDRAADGLSVPDGAAALLDLGGNVRSLGGRWRTGVLDPSGAGMAATVDLRAGEALATSATYYRGAHITDGRTGLSVSNGVASVTVLCPSAMWADGLSTTLFILGPDEGRAFLDNRLSGLCGDLRVAVLWIMKDGVQLTYGDARFQRN